MQLRGSVCLPFPGGHFACESDMQSLLGPSTATLQCVRSNPGSREDALILAPCLQLPVYQYPCRIVETLEDAQRQVPLLR